MNKIVLGYIVGFFAICLFVYGGHWITKHGSYFFFYEDMVQETITEMVKPESLK